MNKENKKELLIQEQENNQPVLDDTSETIKQVEEITEAVDTTVSETSLPDKMSDLSIMLDNLSEEVDSWREWHKNDYLAVIETLKSQVEEMQHEWNNVSSSMKTQREKLESLLESFPGVIETATLKALSLRVTYLEKLVSQVFQESQAKSTAIGARKQLVISLAALVITICLWGAFFVINIIK